MGMLEVMLLGIALGMVARLVVRQILRPRVLKAISEISPESHLAQLQKTLIFSIIVLSVYSIVPNPFLFFVDKYLWGLWLFMGAWLLTDSILLTSDYIKLRISLKKKIGGE